MRRCCGRPVGLGDYMIQHVKRALLVGAMLVVTVAASGCVNMNIGLNFHDDGSVDLKTAYEIAPSFMDNNARQNLKKDAQKARDEGYTVQESDNGLTQAKTFKDAGELATLKLFEQNQVANNKGIQIHKGLLYDDYNIDIFAKGQGNAAAQFSKSGGYDPYGMQELANQTAKMALDSMKLDLNITMPSGFEMQNAKTLSADKNTATWDMRPAVMNNKDIAVKAQFRIYHKVAITIVSIIVAGCFIGTIVMVVLGYLRRNDLKQRNLFLGVAGGFLVVFLGLGGYMTYSLAKAPTFTDADSIQTEPLDKDKKPATEAKADAKAEPAKTEQKDPKEIGQDVLYKYGITGDVVATTYGHNPNGYMMFVGGKGKLFVVVDTKNNRVATVEYYRGPYAGLDKLINGAPGTNDSITFKLRIFDDTRDGDANSGAWSGTEHILPISANFKIDGNGNVVPGMLFSGAGAEPRHHHSVLNEAKNVDLANLVLTETPELEKKSKAAGDTIM